MNETQDQQKQELNTLGAGVVKLMMLLDSAFIIGILTVRSDTLVTDIHLVQMQPSNVLYCFILSLVFLVILSFLTYGARWCDYKVSVKNDKIWYVPGKFAQFIAALSAIFAFALTLTGFVFLSTYFYDDNLTVPVVLPLLDHGLYALHIFIIVFNLFGWITVASRPFHRWLVSITAICWGGIGYMLGSVGYCALTDWHWAVKKQLGATELPDSFITYLINQAGYTPEPAQVDLGTGIAFGVVIIITLIMWYMDMNTEEKTKKNQGRKYDEDEQD